MEAAASFLEYLVTGYVGFLWLLAVLSSQFNLKSLDEAKIALLLPLAYVFGMLIDNVSKLLVFPFQSRIRKKKGLPDSDVASFITIAYSSEQLAKAYLFRSTRDRIARGATLNLLALGIVSLFRPTSGMFGVSLSQVQTTWLFFSIAVSCFAIWWKFETASAAFEKEALKFISSKKDLKSKQP